MAPAVLFQITNSPSPKRAKSLQTVDRAALKMEGWPILIHNPYRETTVETTTNNTRTLGKVCGGVCKVTQVGQSQGVSLSKH